MIVQAWNFFRPPTSMAIPSYRCKFAWVVKEATLLFFLWGSFCWHVSAAATGGGYLSIDVNWGAEAKVLWSFLQISRILFTEMYLWHNKLLFQNLVKIKFVFSLNSECQPRQLRFFPSSRIWWSNFVPWVLFLHGSQKTCLMSDHVTATGYPYTCLHSTHTLLLFVCWEIITPNF